jgi:MFS superfamily sulfate permease-like transporter
MTALNLINQLLNFVAPAAGVALLVVLAARLFSGFFSSKRPPAHGWKAQAAIVFIAGVLLLLAGLLVFGRDGKVASYALLAVGAATCQWLLLRGWKA